MNKSIAPYQIEYNIIKFSQSSEIEQKQNSVYKYIKEENKMDKNYCYREISSENNQFQLFRLDSNTLREIFEDHGESMINWENDYNLINNEE